MTETVKLWRVKAGDELIEFRKSKLALEERLEKWLASDISILSPDLLVIGQQVQTAAGGFIDLLCLDSIGTVVIVELKRDKTPREITAQVLDYASWVKDLSHADLTAIANKYLGRSGPLEEAFKRHFPSDDLPEQLNDSHRMLVVGSEIDESTERIIRYLSDTHGVGINAATFQYFQEGGEDEFLARVFLVEPSEVERRVSTRGSSHRRRNLTLEELKEIAEKNGVGKAYIQITEQLEALFEAAPRQRYITFAGKIGDSKKAMFSIIPEESSSQSGLKFIAYTRRLADYFGVDEGKIVALLATKLEPHRYYENAPPDLWGYSGYFQDPAEIERFVDGLNRTA